MIARKAMLICRTVALSTEALMVKLRLIKGPLGQRIKPVTPAIHAPTLASLEADILWSVDAVMKTLWRPSRHICYYRAYSLVCLLRAEGIEAVLNVGGRGLGDPGMKKAHCWVTVQGRTVFELENEYDLYPERIGTNAQGTVQYWLGPAFDRKAALSDPMVAAHRAYGER